MADRGMTSELNAAEAEAEAASPTAFPIAPYLWMIGGCFTLAWMGQFAHWLKDSCDWRVVAAARASIAFILAFTIARTVGAKLVLWKPYALWFRGCASSASLLCTFYALAQLPTSEVLTLTNTFPIWVAFLSWPMLRVAPSLAVWVAAACGVLGVAVIQSPHFEANPGSAWPIGLAVSAALTNALAMLGLNRLRGLNPWAVVVHYSGFATAVVFATCLMGEMPRLDVLAEPRVLALLLGVGVAATLGQFCVTQAFTNGPPTQMSIVALSQILFALALDLIFERGSMHASAFLGIGLILLPTAWVIWGRGKPATIPTARECPEEGYTAAPQKCPNPPDCR
jgi:drug/metabolite transporter (DMT)-like permease